MDPLHAIHHLIAGLTQGGFIAVLAIVGVPILTLLWILYLRVMVEIGSVLFRIAGDISTMARTVARPVTGTPPAGPAGSWPQTPQAPPGPQPPDRPQDPPPSPNV